MVDHKERAKSRFFKGFFSRFIGCFIVGCWMQTGSAGAILDEPILGGRMLVAQDGYVTADFLGSDAGYHNTLYLELPGEDVWLFDKYTPVDRGPIDLGYFVSGTELVFRLSVKDTGLNFFTGDAARNPDGIAHAMATTSLDDLGTHITVVGFEDLLDGGDMDFNDFVFQLSSVVDPLPAPIPVPPVLLLLSIGLFGLHQFCKEKADVVAP